MDKTHVCVERVNAMCTLGMPRSRSVALEGRLVGCLYSPMIYKAPYAMLLMRENPLRGHVGGFWALGIVTFLGPVKRHLALGECHLGPKLVFLRWPLRLQLPTA